MTPIMTPIITEYDEDAEDFEPVLPEDHEEAMQIVDELAPLPELK